MPLRADKNLARRSFSKEQVAHQRVALVALSLVLIVYALAGGTIEHEVTLLNLPIEFKRPIVLLFAAWAIWGYFLYRYILMTDPPWGAFLEEVNLHALADRRVKAMCLPALARFDIPVDWRATAHRQCVDGWTFAISKRDGGYHFDPGQFFRPSTQATPSGASGQIGYFPLSVTETWTFRLALLLAWVRAIAFETTFSEVVLPYLLVWLTPVIWLGTYWQTIWHFFSRLVPK